MPVQQLILVRHGESEGNTVAAAAEDAGVLRIDVPARDAEVVLSDLGRTLAESLGRRLATLQGDDRPTALWVSTYRRARETAELALGSAGLDLPRRVDERLRDRELGILDTLTSHGVEKLHPEEAERRRFLGKYYYRPPGGESWADVALRLRSVLADLEAAVDGTALVVTHDAVVTLFRSVLEGIEEQDLLEQARRFPVPNTGVTRLVRRAGGGWDEIESNDVRHLEPEHVTEHPGEDDGTRP
jgi:broad specificity phosphatase PhoE